MSHFRLLPHRLLTEPKAKVTSLESGTDCSRATLEVGGLVCSACASNVESELMAVPGVQTASVDLARGVAQVSYNPEVAGPDKLVTAVERAVVARPFRRLLATVARHRPKGRTA